MVTVPGLGPPAIVPPPPLERGPHGLLSAAQQATTWIDPKTGKVVEDTDERWIDGLAFQPIGVFDRSYWDALPTDGTFPGAQKSAGARPPAEVQYAPYVIDQAVFCSTMGDPMLHRERAIERLELITEPSLEFELWTGKLKGKVAYGGTGQNMALVDCPAVDGRPYGSKKGILNPGGPAAPVAVTPGVALALLNQALAGAMPGARGMIHAPLNVATQWTEAGFCIDEDDVLLTKAQHNIIVAGNGYPGTGPANAVVGTTTQWVYATQPVVYRLSKGDAIVVPDTLAEAVTRTTNDVLWRAERYAAAYFDPAVLFGVLVTVA